MKLKEKLINIFGGFGYFISLIFWILPVVAIKISFNLPFWTTFIFTALLFFAPTLSSAVFWIIGLIGFIMGPQDILAIVYYILFASLFLPSIFIFILGFFSKD